jgi:hypothetical protein
MPTQPEWSLPLQYRVGSPQFLAGIDVFHDFDWTAVFGHDRSQFPRGQSLAELVYRDCPVGKHPTLLLTEQEDATPGIVETDERYTVVVPIEDYLSHSGADPASTYYARLCATPMTRLATLAEVDFSPEQLHDFLAVNLTLDALVAWAGNDSQRVDTLRQASSATSAAPSTVPVNDAVAALRRLSVLDEQVIDAVVAYLGGFEGEEGVRQLLNRLTESEGGRASAASVLSDRLVDRIADTRSRIESYRELIASPRVTETDVQGFLAESPWIVGLPYVAARPRVRIPRGEIDFVLDRFDGFFDIVELKGPREHLIMEPNVAGSRRPASASAYALGPSLSGALAQAHHYRSILDQGRELSRQYGLGDCRAPRILIVLGRSSDLSDAGREILRQLNLTLHRVEVIPYDVLGTRTEGLLANIESLAGACD